MLVIFHMIVITCQIFNLPHIYCIFVKKTYFFDGIQTWFKQCEMPWFNITSTFIKIKNDLNYFWNIFVSTNILQFIK
jgi:hypothetical protein